MRLLPNESIAYFGDTARLPYGSKSRETVIHFSREIAAFLVRQNIKCLLVACNTASSCALETLAGTLDIPIAGVIDPAQPAGGQGQSRIDMGARDMAESHDHDDDHAAGCQSRGDRPQPADPALQHDRCRREEN